MFQEQAARLIQRWWRKKHKYSFNGKYEETLNGPLSLKFIKEPKDQKYKEHAANMNDWLNLDFSDKDFIRNLYKAFRKKLISSRQLSTALQLQQAIIFFTNLDNETNLHYHSFEKKGPYDPKNITYSTPEKLKTFYTELKKIPPQERIYFGIDLPSNHEPIFLFFGLINDLANPYLTSYSNSFNLFLTEYIKKLCLPNKKYLELIEHIAKVTNNDSKNALIEFMSKQIMSFYPHFKYELINGKKNISIPGIGFILLDTYNLLTLILGVNEQNPSFVLSPRYKKDNPDTPLLSFILPTTEALITLQSAMHGEHTTLPTFRVGRLTPIDMLKTFLNNKNSRLVEIIHPDVKEAKIVHESNVHSLAMMWHDQPFHIWRNGANMYKELFVHLIHLFQNNKNVEISKAIWILVDGDTNLGRKVLESKIKGYPIADIIMDHIVTLLERIGDEFWVKFDKSDHNLLIMIDMIINKEIWKRHLGIYPEDLFPRDVRSGYLAKYDFPKLHSILAEMEEILSHCSEADQKDTVKSAILMYRLKNQSKDLLPNTIDNKDCISYLDWTRNGDLTINKELPQKTQFLSNFFKPSSKLLKIKESKEKNHLEEKQSSKNSLVKQ